MASIYRIDYGKGHGFSLRSSLADQVEQNYGSTHRVVVKIILMLSYLQLSKVTNLRSEIKSPVILTEGGLESFQEIAEEMQTLLCIAQYSTFDKFVGLNKRMSSKA